MMNSDVEVVAVEWKITELESVAINKMGGIFGMAVSAIHNLLLQVSTTNGLYTIDLETLKVKIFGENEYPTKDLTDLTDCDLFGDWYELSR